MTDFLNWEFSCWFLKQSFEIQGGEGHQAIEKPRPRGHFSRPAFLLPATSQIVPDSSLEKQQQQKTLQAPNYMFLFKTLAVGEFSYVSNLNFSP